MVEEEEGIFALWLSYLVTGAGENIVSWLILPRTIVSVGASSDVFWLFSVSVLVKISGYWRKILEVLILGQFVIEKVMDVAQDSTQFVGAEFAKIKWGFCFLERTPCPQQSYLSLRMGNFRESMRGGWK